MANYLTDSELFYEMVVSKGKGKLTRKAEKYLTLIASKLIRRFSYRFKNIDEEKDCEQYGLLVMFEHWYGFDEKKYKTALPYYTEIAKRGMTYQFNELRGRRSHQKNYIKFVSLDSSNDGNGLHNF